MKDRGIPLQYSLFYHRATRAQARQLAQTLNTVIDHRVDDVRLYPLPNAPTCHMIGQRTLPDGILFDFDSLKPSETSVNHEGERCT